MSFKRYLAYISVYSIALFLAAGILTLVFSRETQAGINLSLLQWDGHWYLEIAQKGYSFHPDHHSSVAFFPLLPLLFKLVSFNIIAVITLNWIVSMLSLRMLSSLTAYQSSDIILFLSTPLLLYFFVPYTEALFLLGSALLLWGLHKNSVAAMISGAFIAILSRYAAVMLVPALLLTACYDVWGQKENKRNALRLYGPPMLSLLGGLALVSLIQYLQAGVWDGYQQTHVHWGHYLQWPSLPFYSAMGSAMLLLDQVALLIAVCAGILILYIFWCIYTRRHIIAFSRIQFLSLAYLAGSGASMILFQGGSLDSLGRYIFATAFLFPLFSWLRQLSFKPLQLIYIFTSCSFFFLFTGSLNSWGHFLANEMIALAITLLYLFLQLNKTKKLPWNYILIGLGGFALQVILLTSYLLGFWVE